MDNLKILEIIVVYDKDLLDTSIVINNVENSNVIIKEISTLVNTYTCCNNLNDNKISGYSLNKFVKNDNKVFISRYDNLYLANGNIDVNFCFDRKFSDINELIKLLPGSKIYLIPTYKSEYFEDKNIDVILEIYEGYRTYKIAQKIEN